MYIASSLLRGVSYNEILMYNSGQLYEYSYYQRLNKRLATGLIQDVDSIAPLNIAAK